jgi:hypothetical protein
MVQVQNSISLSNMLFDETFEAHRAQILSCSGLGAGVWFTTQLIFLTFQLFSLICCTSLHTRLGLPHPLITSIPQCVCTHPIDLMGIHLLHCAHSNEHTGTHDVIHNTFSAIT